MSHPAFCVPLKKESQMDLKKQRNKNIMKFH